MNEFALYASGELFDVDSYLANATFAPERVWRFGKLDSPEYGQTVCTTSGFKHVLGDGAAIGYLEQQRLAESFIVKNRASLKALAGFPGIETAGIFLQFNQAFSDGPCGFLIPGSGRLCWYALGVSLSISTFVNLE